MPMIVDFRKKLFATIFNHACAGRFQEIIDLKLFLKMPLGPFPLTQIVVLIWVAIRSATQISATIFIFMCGDRKVAIISAILIAIRAPLIVRLFENNRDYLK